MATVSDFEKEIPDKPQRTGPGTGQQVTESPEHWDMVIQPKTFLLDLHLADVWRYRDLMALFVKRDFVAKYKQTVLGPVWHLVQPVLTAIIFLILFGRIARLTTDGIQPILFYLSGITIWNYFSVSITNTSNTFVANANIFGKVYFPRLVLPISIVLSNIIQFGIQFALLLSVMIWYNFNGFPMHITLNWLLLPFLILMMAGIALGMGIIISSITTKYRDFSVLLTFAVQLGMYVTPIAYPLSFLKNRSFEWMVSLNPLTAIVESYRYVLFGKGTVDAASIGYSFAFMIITLFAGTIIFNKVERSFMDTV